MPTMGKRRFELPASSIGDGWIVFGGRSLPFLPAGVNGAVFPTGGFYQTYVEKTTATKFPLYCSDIGHSNPDHRRIQTPIPILVLDRLSTSATTGSLIQ